MNIIDLAEQAEEHANNIVRNIDNCESWGFLRDQKFAALVEAVARADEREQIAAWYETEGQMIFPVAIPKIIRARGTT